MIKTIQSRKEFLKPIEMRLGRCISFRLVSDEKIALLDKADAILKNLTYDSSESEVNAYFEARKRCSEIE